MARGVNRALQVFTARQDGMDMSPAAVGVVYASSRLAYMRWIVLVEL